MKRTRHTPEQIIRKLRTADQLISRGKKIAEVCRDIEGSQPNYHRWRQQYGGYRPRKPASPPTGEGERPLKKLLAEAELEKAMHC